MSPALKTLTAALLYTSFISATALPQASGAAKEFHLEPVVTIGDASFNGLSVTGVHTGAGESAAEATNNASLAETFTLNSTYLSVAGGAGTPPVPDTFNLIIATPYMSDAPDSYNLVDIDFGLYSQGFSIDENNIVQYSGPLDFKTFALCNVNGTAPYLSLGPDTQLLWKNSSSVAEAPKCADVQLKADYIS